MMDIKNESCRGFTIVESLVGLTLIVISVVAALGGIHLLVGGQKKNEDDLDFIAKRNQILSYVIDDTAWIKMVPSTQNPKMSCLALQNSNNPSVRDCSGKEDGLYLMDIKGALIYDFLGSMVSLSRAGRSCTTYSSSPGSGDPQCPYRVDIQWQALCNAPPCVNPPLRFIASFSFNSTKQQIQPNLTVMNFEIIKYGLFCPPDVSPTGLIAGVQTDYLPPAKITSNQNIKIQTVGVGRSDQVMTPCRRIEGSFSDDMPVPGDLSAPYLVMDVENNSSVAIVDDGTGVPIYEFRRMYVNNQYSYDLIYKGMTVFTKPSWLVIDKGTVFKFKITGGLVKFCVNDRCYHYFKEKLDFPFRFSYRPAALPYSPNGINNIGTNLSDF